MWNHSATVFHQTAMSHAQLHASRIPGNLESPNPLTMHFFGQSLVLEGILFPSQVF